MPSERKQATRRKLPLILGMVFILLLACSCPMITQPGITPTPAQQTTATLRQIGTPTELTFLPPPPIPSNLPLFNFSFEDRTPFQVNLNSVSRSALDSLPGATVYHLAFSFSDPPNQATCLEEIRYTNTEDVPLDEVFLALFPELMGGSLDVLDVSISDFPVDFDVEEWLLRIPFNETLRIGESVDIQISFTVEVPTGGSDLYYGIFGYNSGILSFAHAYPTILVYNNEGWNKQVPDLDGDPLFADASFYLISINAPVDLVLVYSGVDYERTELGSRQHILIANGPARDFYLAGSKNWIKKSLTLGNEITVHSYSSASVESQSESGLETAVSALEVFSQRYGAYPYSEFDVAPIITSAGGVEYPGMTSISNQAYYWGDYLNLIIVHEVAHMWFYDLVGNDTLDQPWLDESLAQFATWQYYLDIGGPARADAFAEFDLRMNWNMALEPDTAIGLPVSAYQGNDYASIVYGRGPFFFMALREQIGVETFDRLMQEYVTKFTWAISSTEQFRSLAETFCHCDLGTLFQEWIYP